MTKESYNPDKTLIACKILNPDETRPDFARIQIKYSCNNVKRVSLFAFYTVKPQNVKLNFINFSLKYYKLDIVFIYV